MNKPTKLPVSPIREGQSIDGLLVACPICNEEYVHVDDTSHHVGNDAYEAKVFGSDVRGDVYSVGFWSECGSEFRLVFGFHKGMTFVHTFIEKDCRDAQTEGEPGESVSA